MRHDEVWHGEDETVPYIVGSCHLAVILMIILPHTFSLASTTLETRRST